MSFQFLSIDWSFRVNTTGFSFTSNTLTRQFRYISQLELISITYVVLGLVKSYLNVWEYGTLLSTIVYIKRCFTKNSSLISTLSHVHRWYN